MTVVAGLVDDLGVFAIYSFANAAAEPVAGTLTGKLIAPSEGVWFFVSSVSYVSC